MPDLIRFAGKLPLVLLLLLPFARVAGQAAAPARSEVITVRFDDSYSLPEGEEATSYSFLVPVPLRNDSATFAGTPYRIIYPGNMHPDSVAVASTDTGGDRDNPLLPFGELPHIPLPGRPA